MSILPRLELHGSSSSRTPCPNSPPLLDNGVSHSRSPQLSPPSPSLSGALDSPMADPSDISHEVNELGTMNRGMNLADQTANLQSLNSSVGREVRPSPPVRGRSQANRVSARYQQSDGFATPQKSSAPSGGRRAQLTNGNHLLNFHYDPISRSQPRAPPPRRQHKVKPYNKDLFLQANYKFVVLDSGKYTAESVDPDKMLMWEDVICVRFSTPSFVQCPICLEPPLCPQITSCGHIFCFPCILQYLLMGKEDEKGESWKRCPLCFLMISPNDLYTLFLEYVGEYKVGDKVEFLLLSRQKESNTLTHKIEMKKDVETESYDPFSKFTFTSDVDLAVRKPISDLDSWLAKADAGLVDDIEKLPYVCAALKQLEQKKKYWVEHRVCDSNKSEKIPDQTTCSNNTQANEKVSKCSSEVSISGVQDRSSEFGELNIQTFSDLSFDAIESSDGQKSILPSSYDEFSGVHRNIKGSLNVTEKDFYNFYQAADGQHIILHPLNMNCLLHHFGSQNLLPDRIHGKILQFETVTQSEAIRRRFRFLSHFSLTTTFQLCEIDLSESLPPDALLPFMDDIKKREKQRKQTARKEQKEKIKAEAAMEGLVPTYSSFQHSSYNESRGFSMDDFEALGTSSGQSSSPPIVGERKLFSSVTKLGFAAAHDSPSLKIEENSNMGRLNPCGVTGGSSEAGTKSFANVISIAKTAETAENPKTSEVGKKGKKTGRVLLSTAGGRRY